MPVYWWSRTASDNGNSDPTVNFLEGQTPGSLNDSGRAMIAALRKYVDDISGAIVTTGTATAYAVSSYSAFDSLAHLNGQMIAFSPHATNGAGPVTLSVDSLGAKALRSSPGVELQSNSLIAGTPYVAVYNSSDAAFYLQGNAGGTYGVPLGAGMEYWGATAPSSAFVFPTGQAISRTTYATLFSLFSTTYGVGDGSTTFNLPDPTGRVRAIKESSASRLTSTFFGGNSTVLGAVGGAESHTLTTAQLAAHSHPVFLNDPGHTHSYNQPASFGASGSAAGILGTSSAANTGSSATGITVRDTAGGAGTANQTATAGSGNAHNNVQPTIVCNYILRCL